MRSILPSKDWMFCARSSGSPPLPPSPSPAMGAIIIFAATRLVDADALARIARFRRSEIVLTAATALGVAAYALLSGQGAPWTAYLADLAMGTATGGIIGAIVSNISGK